MNFDTVLVAYPSRRSLRDLLRMRALMSNELKLLILRSLGVSRGVSKDGRRAQSRQHEAHNK